MRRRAVGPASRLPSADPRVSRLFDSAWYLRTYPDVAASGADPLLHFMRSGALEGRDPHPLFDTSWYLAEYPDVTASGLNALVHFVTIGYRNHNPNPYFDSAWYSATYLAGEPLTTNPLLHYLEIGVAHGFDPSPHFDADWYLSTNKDVTGTGMEPLQHFMTIGDAEGRDPNPLFQARWYLEQYPDVEVAGVPALWHYLVAGSKEERVPRKLDKWLDPLLEADPRPVTEGFPGPGPVATIVIPIHGNWPYTERCLRALRKTEASELARIVVVDDCSPDDSREQLVRYPEADVLVLEEHHGYSRAVNAGGREVVTPYVMLLRSDTEPQPGFLTALVERFQAEPQAALVGSRLVQTNGSIADAGSIVWADASLSQYGRNDRADDHRYTFAREVDSCSAYSLLVRSQFWMSAGGLDSRYPTDSHAALDLAFAARAAGMRAVFEPRSVVVWHESPLGWTESATGQARSEVADQRRFAEKWDQQLRLQSLTGEVPPDIAATRGWRRLVVIVREEVITPERDSGSFRMAQMIESWEQLGYRVVLVSPNQDPLSTAALAATSRGLELVTEPEEIIAFLRRNREWIACIVYSHIGVMWSWHPRLSRRARHVPVVFDTVDLHHLREMAQAEVFDDLLGRLRAERTRAREMWAIDKARATLVVSDSELAYLRESRPKADVRVISNIHPHPVQGPTWGERRGLVFVGYFNHTPNLDGIAWFLDEVWPLLPEDIRIDGLDIIGAPPPANISERGLPGVSVLGWVPATDPYLDAARISIAPLRFGGGVKGKVGEAWSRGLPVAGTSVAIDGMSADYPRADTAADLAQLITELYRDEDRWIEARDMGAREIRARFSLAAATESLRQLQHDLDRGRETGDRARTLASGRLTPWLLPSWPEAAEPPPPSPG